MRPYADALAQAEQRLRPLDGGVLGGAATMARDEAETFDTAAVAAIHERGLGAWQLPGGSLERLVAGAYALSRRDASLALTCGLDVWSQLVWMAGSAEQQAQVRAAIEAGEGICLAASERDRGADLSATETVATAAGGRLTLTGEKWPIGRASHSRLALVLARTEARPGPRASSWLLVDLRASNVERLPRVATLGFRGADVSGLRFDETALPETCFVGGRGRGVELALRLFQITRPLVASLALGPADTALRWATRFVCSRRLYGDTVSALPAVRRGLVRAWTRLVVAELLAVTAARTAHLVPDELVVASAAAKALMPGLAKASLDESVEVLGARFFFREGWGDGRVQKALRDQLAVATFDGSTPVCLHGLGLQLPALLGEGERSSWSAITESTAVSALDYAGIGLTSRGRDGIVRAADEIRETADPALRPLASEAIAELEDVRTRVAARGPGFGRSAALIDCARDYATARARLLTVATSTQTPPRCGTGVLALGFGGTATEAAIDEAFEVLVHAAQTEAPLSGWWHAG